MRGRPDFCRPVFDGCVTSILKHLLALFLIPYKNEQKCMSFLVEKSQASRQRMLGGVLAPWDRVSLSY